MAGCDRWDGDAEVGEARDERPDERCGDDGERTTGDRDAVTCGECKDGLAHLDAKAGR